VGVTLHVEIAEVKFPDETVAGPEVGQVTVCIGKRETHLDKVEDINVGFEEGVVLGGFKVAAGGFCRNHHLGEVNNSGEFSIHGNKRVIVDYAAKDLKLRFKVGGPDRTDQDPIGLGMGRVLVDHTHLESLLQQDEEKKEEPTQGFFCLR